MSTVTGFSASTAGGVSMSHPVRLRYQRRRYAKLSKTGTLRRGSQRLLEVGGTEDVLDERTDGSCESLRTFRTVAGHRDGNCELERRGGSASRTQVARVAQRRTSKLLDEAVKLERERKQCGRREGGREGAKKERRKGREGARERGRGERSRQSRSRGVPGLKELTLGQSLVGTRRRSACRGGEQRRT